MKKGTTVESGYDAEGTSFAQAEAGIILAVVLLKMKGNYI